MEVTVFELFFIQLLAAAALKTRERLEEKHGPYMPPDAYKTTELCDKLIWDADRLIAPVN